MLISKILILTTASLVVGKVRLVGMNIAGFESGCEIDGTCPISSASPPLSSLGGADGLGQMQRFARDDQMNIFRLPVSWQFLVNDQLGGTLDSTNFGNYDQLMQVCLSTGSYRAIDIHNFARFNGQIIGQSSGGPTNEDFSALWSHLATKYKTNPKVVFGLMNEPHDVDIGLWANSVQAAVAAIRNAGAVPQMILLPGNNFSSAATFVSNGSAAALSKVSNPDGSFDGLILDIHKYLDEDNSGTHDECTTDNISDAFQLVANFLRESGRQALVSETGAGSTSSCFVDFCAQNTFLNQNSDVFLGYIAWAAGSFATSYTLSLTPSEQNGKLVDNALASQCVVAPWLNARNTATFVSSAATSTTLVSSAVATSGSAPGRSSSTTTAASSASSVLVTSAIPTEVASSAVVILIDTHTSLLRRMTSQTGKVSWQNATGVATSTGTITPSSTSDLAVATGAAAANGFKGHVVAGGLLLACIL